MQAWDENLAPIPIVGKSGFVSHTKHTVEATYMDLFHSWLITSIMWFSEFENKIAYLGAVKFKTKDLKFLGTLLIFTPIPLYAQEVWSLNQFLRENNRVVSLAQTHHFSIIILFLKKNFCMFLPFITNWLSNWAGLLGLSNWALMCGLEWDQKGPIRH